jgi:hypothetical protein
LTKEPRGEPDIGPRRHINGSQPDSHPEWSANQHDQIITHRATGLQFRAFPLRQASVGGFVTPFNRSSEIALRLTNFPRGTQLPMRDRVYEIAKQGMLWIKTYTYEAARGR